MCSDTIRLGVIGCGGFGLFAVQHFVQAEGIELVAIAGTHREAAIAAAARFGAPDIQDVEDLVRRDDMDVVYIATPPFLHHPQTISASRAGKHVICEKPLALTIEQADELNRGGRALRPADRGQPHAALQPSVRNGPQADQRPHPRRAVARIFRELRGGRGPTVRPLVLGTDQERQHLRRTGGHFFNPFAG